MEEREEQEMWERAMEEREEQERRERERREREVLELLQRVTEWRRERERREQERWKRETEERAEQERRARETEERAEQERRERETEEMERQKKEVLTFICVLLMVSLFLGFLFGISIFFFIYTVVVAFLSSAFIEDLCSRITDRDDRVCSIFICTVLAYLLFSGTNVIKPFFYCNLQKFVIS
jgi:uncharacterized membrane protein YdbT with pleckstrin-like domain